MMLTDTNGTYFEPSENKQMVEGGRKICWNLLVVSGFSLGVDVVLRISCCRWMAWKILPRASFVILYSII